MKKLVSLLLALTMMLTMVACGGSDDPKGPTTAAGGSSEVFDAEGAPEFLFIFGHGAAEESIGDLYCKEFKRLVEEASHGKIKVDVYSGSTIGSYNEMIQNVSTGDQGGLVLQPSPIVSVIPYLSMLDLPYAFYGCTSDQINWVLNESDFATKLREQFAENNVYYVSSVNAGGYRETTSKNACKTVADFKGLNIRTLENNYHMAFWSQIGANPTPIAFAELYLSLQQGLVDAQENPFDTSYAAGFQEVQDYLIMTDHIAYNNMFLVSKTLFDSMPAEYQAVFNDCAAQAREYARGLMADADQTYKTKMLDEGMELIELADDVKAELKSNASVVEGMLRTDLGNEIVDAFLSSIEQAKTK